jgi:hypothetical protein
MYYLVDATSSLEVLSRHKTLKAAKAAGQRCRLMDLQILQGDSGLSPGHLNDMEFEAFNLKEISDAWNL